MHISSLPGKFGIGNLGQPAHDFVDYLADAGFRHWQICPIGPTGYGDSPYQSFSSFAGNPYFIDLDQLVKARLLTEGELVPLFQLPNAEVDYGWLYAEFWPILETAHQRFIAIGDDEVNGHSYKEFIESESEWLDGYAAFMALKAHHGGRPWQEWEECYRDFNALSLDKLPSEIQELAASHKFYQFLFFTQWESLHEYAREKGIRIVGDIPIFVSMDSADAWQFREVFRLDEQGEPEALSGVPPDYFSEDGQFWGNPLYDWEYLKSTNYDWWVKRLKACFRTCDVLRLDHFRAFDTYWEIPAGSTNARIGNMRDGPGMDFFESISRQIPELPIIAEDLGYITEGTVRLRQQAGFPGMKILQFGYGHDDNNVNLPHFYPRESVVYTGTHDNDTTRGWLSSLDGESADQIRGYYKLKQGDCSAWGIIEAGFACVSLLAVFPCQDLLDLGSEARMNKPGTMGNNWKWRLTKDQLTYLKATTVHKLLSLQKTYDRTGDSKQREYSAPPETTELARH